MLRPGFIATLSDWVSRRLSEHPAELETALAAFGMQETAEDYAGGHRLIGFFSEWIVYDRKSPVFEGATGLEYFVKHNPLYLPESEMAAYRDLLDFKCGFFDVAAVALGRNVVLEDGAGIYEVADVNASMSLKEGETIWCRIASVRGVYQMTSSTILSAPITLSKALKADFAREGTNSDAREAARWASERVSGPRDQSAKKRIPVDEAARLLDEAFRSAGMQDMLTSDTVKKWAHNERSFLPGFPIKAVFFLLPEDLDDEKRDAIISTLNIYLNNLPRRALKGKAPVDAVATQAPEDRHFDIDRFGYGDYAVDLRAAHDLMRENKNVHAYKAFETLVQRLLADKVPIITAFRIYANAATSLLADSEGTDPLGRELIRACLRLNPLYDFGLRQKERLLDPYEDFSYVPKKDWGFAKDVLATINAIGARKYRRTAFRRYEDFLAKCGISLKYATKTTPTIFSTKEGAILKTGRNTPCPCGSGKKYKKCCGR